MKSFLKVNCFHIYRCEIYTNGTLEQQAKAEVPTFMVYPHAVFLDKKTTFLNPLRKLYLNFDLTA